MGIMRNALDKRNHSRVENRSSLWESALRRKLSRASLLATSGILLAASVG